MSNEAATGKRIVILGALSAIAEAAARIWAREPGAHLVLVGRSADRLESVAANLRALGARAETFPVDLDTADPASVFPQLVAPLGGVDIVLLAYGTLGEQKTCEQDFAAAARLMHTNFTSAAGWCLAAANVLEAQGKGVLCVIGSVAGDRGRASNYVYGAAKGGLGILVQGLAHRLSKKGARAVLVKPGFVDTPMTAHIAGRGGLLWSSPDRVARVIVKAAEPGARVPVAVYAPGFWRTIMRIIRNVPERVFHKTSL